MSLLSAAERFANIDRSAVVYDPERCLHTRDQNSSCTACLNLCPADAIAIGTPPVLQTDRCQSCLACLPVCPVGAFHADDDVSAVLNCVTHVDGKSVELVCGLHPHPEKGENSETIGIRIQGCLAGMGTGAYLTLSALGLERIILRTEACHVCKWQNLRGQIHRQAELANRLLSAWNNLDPIVRPDQIEMHVERPLWNAKNPPLSRRDLFRMLAQQGQVAMARAMENGVNDSKRQHGRDRLRLKSAVSHLPEHGSGSTVNLDGFGFASLTISESCVACGICGRACPTKALRFEINEGETAFKLLFSALDCIGCDLCAHVCAPAAITLDHTPAFEQVFMEKEPILLLSGDLVRCQRCKTLIATRPDAKLCPLCEYRRTHPFGSKLPPGIKSALQKAVKDSQS